MLMSVMCVLYSCGATLVGGEGFGNSLSAAPVEGSATSGIQLKEQVEGAYEVEGIQMLYVYIEDSTPLLNTYVCSYVYEGLELEGMHTSLNAGSRSGSEESEVEASVSTGIYIRVYNAACHANSPSLSLCSLSLPLSPPLPLSLSLPSSPSLPPSLSSLLSLSPSPFLHLLFFPSSPSPSLPYSLSPSLFLSLHIYTYPPGQDESSLSLPSMNSHVTRELSVTAWILRSIAPWSTRSAHRALMINGTLVLFGGWGTGKCLM